MINEAVEQSRGSKVMGQIINWLSSEQVDLFEIGSKLIEEYNATLVNYSGVLKRLVEVPRR